MFTSAKGVYGPVTGEYGSPTWKPMPEDLPAKPKRIYDSAKFMGENVCAYYNDNMGLETVSLRFASTYGPGKTARHGPMAVMSRIVENPAAGLPFRLEQGGDDKDDFIYNKDSALGIYLATTADKVKSRVYNIGTGVGVTLRDFERVIKTHIPNARMEIGGGLNFYGFAYPATGVYDISRARGRARLQAAIRSREGDRRLSREPRDAEGEGRIDHTCRHDFSGRNRICVKNSSCPACRSPSAIGAGPPCAKRWRRAAWTRSCCGAGR